MKRNLILSAVTIILLSVSYIYSIVAKVENEKHPLPNNTEDVFKTYTDDFYIEMDIMVGFKNELSDGNDNAESLEYYIRIIQKDPNKIYESLTSSISLDDMVKNHLLIPTRKSCSSYFSKEEDAVNIGNGYSATEFEYVCFTWIDKEAINSNFDSFFNQDIFTIIEWKNGKYDFYFPINEVNIEKK